MRWSSTVRLPFFEFQLSQIMTVEAGFANTVDPRQKRGKDIARAMRGGAGRTSGACTGEAAPRGVEEGCPCPAGSCFSCAERNSAAAAVTGTAAVRDRMLVGASKDRDAAILLNAHGHFRADQVEALGGMWPLRRLNPETCTSAFGALATIVPSASRTTMSRIRTAVPPFGAFYLRAADFHTTAVAEILFNGGGEPGRHDIELNGAVDSLHHSPSHAIAAIAPKAPASMAKRRIKRP